MRLIDIYDTEKLFSQSEIGLKGFIEIEDNKTTTLSWALAKFNIINNLPISYFPFLLTDEVTRLKILCKSEELMSTQVEETIATTTTLGIPITERPTLFDLITKYNKFPANKYLSNGSQDIRVELENASKLRALERFYTNLGQVYYSHLIESITKPGVLIETNAHSYTKQYEQLLLDNVLRLGTESDLPLLLNYKTKKQLVEIITLKRPELNIKNKSKEKLIEILIGEKELYEIKFHEQFFLLNYKYQDLKLWLQKENVYSKLYSILTDEIELAYILIPDVLKELIERNNDYETSVYLLQIFLENLSKFKSIDEFTVEEIKTQYKKIRKNRINYA